MQDSDVEDSTFQLVIDQLEELVVTVIEEVRERPAIVLAVVAGVIGAMIGSRLAARGKRPPTAVRAARGTARRAGAAAELAGIGLRLLQNPLVRALFIAVVERQLKRRLP
ncbi:MAG: hypothetical protein JO352_24855 [Chloroflexi bacterium]|nr:hypothetical protein [Chloroflexota bacterium]MBV9595844.1 hypothetical protein [Chloroflexota bacterium]